MANENIQTQDLKFYVARINKINERVEVLRMNQWNGLFDSLDSTDSDSAFNTAQAANQLAAGINLGYEDKGIKDYYCYVLRSVGNQVHLSESVPSDFYGILETFLDDNEELQTEDEAAADDAAANGKDV